MDDFLKLVEVLAGLVGPCMVVWLTARMEKDRKENARIKELEAAARAQKEEELNKKFTAVIDRIEKIDQSLSEMTTGIADLENVDDKYASTLKGLTKQHTLSWQYIHELAQLVMVLAAGMRDQHLDGNITNAIARCQDFEHKALSNFMMEDHHSEE